MTDDDQTGSDVETVAGEHESAADDKSKRKRRKKRGRSPQRVGEKRVRERKSRPFPASSFEEALTFTREIFKFGGGQPVRRLTLFDHLGKAPDSGPSRMLITNANKYNLTKGSYTSEHLSLTPDGLTAVDDSLPGQQVLGARIRLAIIDIEPFKQLYERFQNVRLPAKAVLIDTLKELGVPPESAEEGVDTFIVNLRFLELLQTLSGAERIVTIDHVLEKIPSLPPIAAEPTADGRSIITQERATFETTCFYITPIGDPNSDERKHSDLFLGSIVEPALAPLGLKIIRADAIETPGIITRQVIEYLLRSRLVIADLSFHNPNVFYELALRHAARMPIVQIIRVGDRIPFDIHQMRTIVIDNTDIYALVPKIQTFRSEIATQARSALEAKAEVDTPISVYFPAFKVTI